MHTSVPTGGDGGERWGRRSSNAKVTQGLGVYADGPIETPADLVPALKRAIAVVKRGEPELVDVVAQPR